MLEKMVGQQYIIPANIGISEECTDLVRQMLLPNPRQRITLDGIMKHPWFRINLPPEASAMNANYLAARPLPGVQTEDEVRFLIDRARRADSGRGASRGAVPLIPGAVVRKGPRGGNAGCCDAQGLQYGDISSSSNTSSIDEEHPASVLVRESDQDLQQWVSSAVTQQRYAHHRVLQHDTFERKGSNASTGSHISRTGS